MNDESRENPFQAPRYDVEKSAVVADEVVEIPPCPRCQCDDVFPTPYSAWHGRRAPKAIQDLTCPKCRCNFDGETRREYPPRKSPLIWFLISLILFLLYLVFYFTVMLPMSF